MTNEEIANELEGVSITAIATGLLNVERLKEKIVQSASENFVSDPLKTPESDRRKLFGERLRMMRKLRGFTQSEFAERLGVSKSFLANCECGRREPSNRNLISMARILNVSADWLLDVPVVS